jgi:hypothetical protein
MNRDPDFEYRFTRDVRVPLVDGDEDMSMGWQNIPIRPTLEQGWEIVADYDSDKKTLWRRRKGVVWSPLFSDD